jgi:hypothetical protein
MIDVIKPGLKYYVDLINARKPFSFVRYGEGEIKWMIPALPTKSGYPSFKDPAVAAELRATLIRAYVEDNYLPAIQHRWHFAEKGRLGIVEEWFEENVPPRRYHWAGVFRRATLQGKLYPLVKAIRQSDLPFILVGPLRIAPLIKTLNAAHHIVTDDRFAYQQIGDLEKRINSFPDPAIISFSCSFAAKTLIWRLFPRRGDKSILIDFGSLWDGYCGLKNRPYHPKMTKALIRKNLKGK